MKYIVSILLLACSITMGWAQQTFEPKVDGTKYYIQVYDGETNEKILYQNAAHASWKTKIQLANFFDGSLSQLWTFRATAMYPGYYSVFNHDENLTESHFLMSWDWNAYMGANRDPADSPEMQYRFVEVADGWYKFETIEKEAGLNGRDYTPGADALNVKPEGFVDFRDVKSADITPANMVNKVFKFEEFNPLTAYDNSLKTGDNLYNSNTGLPQQIRYDFFYTLEKGREVRVFGTESEILANQDVIYEAIAKFTKAVEFYSVLTDARTFIDASGADNDVKNSFNQIVNDAEALFDSGNFGFEELDAITLELDKAQTLVESIVTAQSYALTLDQGLADGLDVSINAAKAVLAGNNSTGDDFVTATSHLERTQEVIAEIIIANELIASTQGYETEVAELTSAVDQVTGTINTASTTVADLDQALVNMQDAINVFKASLNPAVVLTNGGFDADLADWNVDSPTPTVAYAQNRGIDASRSITCWNGSAYQMKIYQSIDNIPNGTYLISCVFRHSHEGSFGLFAESGSNVVDLPLPAYNNGEYDLIKREIEILVEDGTMRFGIRGQGTDNGVPAGNWIVFDEFNMQWIGSLPTVNTDFEANDNANKVITGWTETGTDAAMYPSQKGVDGSKSVTCWSGSNYNAKVSQTLTSLSAGSYTISALANNNDADLFALFYTAGGSTNTQIIAQYASQTKVEMTFDFAGGDMEYGFKGAPADNSVPANRWIVIDNLELKVNSIIPNYVVVVPPVAEEVKPAPELGDTSDPQIIYTQKSQVVEIESTNAIVKYAVYSITGQLIRTMQSNSSNVSIPVKPGIYIVRVITEDGGVDTKKISVF